MLLAVLLINVVYVLPHLLNYTTRGIALYLMFPFPFSLFAGIIAIDRCIRKKIIDVFYKLRFIYATLSIAYLIFLVFTPEGNMGKLVDFSYGNVAWFFLPAIFIYVGLMINQECSIKEKRNKNKYFELFSIFLMLVIAVFYTGLRSGIISIIFTIISYLILFLIIDFKNKQNYLLNTLIVIIPFILAFVLSAILKIDSSRLNVITNNFLFEKKENENNELIEDNDNSKKNLIQNNSLVEDRITINTTNNDIDKSDEVGQISSSKNVEIVYLTATLPVRPQKGSTETLGILSKGTKIEGYIEGSWIRFTYKDTDAYIVLKYTSVERPKEFETMYTTTFLPIRPQKGSTETLGVLSKGTKIEGYVDGLWIRFTYNDEDAYVVSKFTSKENTEEKRMVYTTRFLPIRPQKGSTESLGILPMWTKIEGENDGAWLRFSYKGKEAFIVSEYTRTRAPNEDDLENAVKEKILFENSTGPNPVDKANIIDLEDNQVKSVYSVFVKYIVENDLTKNVTEKQLQADVKNNTKKYIFAREIDRDRISKYTIKKDRNNLWYMAYREFKAKPIWGQGPLFFQSKYDDFFPHNIFLEILVDYGIVGFVIFLVYLMLLLITTLRIIMKNRDMIMVILFGFAISYFPTYLLYDSLYSNNSLLFFSTLFIVYILFNKNKIEYEISIIKGKEKN